MEANFLYPESGKTKATFLLQMCHILPITPLASNCYLKPVVLHCTNQLQFNNGSLSISLSNGHMVLVQD